MRISARRACAPPCREDTHLSPPAGPPIPPRCGETANPFTPIRLELRLSGVPGLSAIESDDRRLRARGGVELPTPTPLAPPAAAARLGLTRVVLSREGLVGEWACEAFDDMRARGRSGVRDRVTDAAGRGSVGDPPPEDKGCRPLVNCPVHHRESVQRCSAHRCRPQSLTNGE